LLKDFTANLNEDFYQKSLKQIETMIDEIGGEKVFQQRLKKLFTQFPFTFVQDDVAEKQIKMDT
jgi:hypothetical protein